LLYCFYGPDDFSGNQALEGIRVSLGDASMLATNTANLEGAQITLNTLRVACETMPFLSEKRLVIVRGLAARFERGKKTAKDKKKAAGEDLLQKIAEYLPNVPDFTVVVLINGDVKKTNTLIKQAIAAKAAVRHFPLLKNQELEQWIDERVAQNGGRISSRAVTMLAQCVGGNLWVMAGEIDKLLSYTDGAGINEEVVEKLVGYVQEANIFGVVDAILEARGSAVSKQLERLLQQGITVSHIMGMLMRQVRIMVCTKDMLLAKTPRAEMQQRLGFSQDWLLRKACNQVSRYTPEQLREVYHKLLTTDMQIKTGKMDSELALHLFTAELSRKGA